MACWGMTKGFASILFLLGIAALLASIAVLHHPLLHESTATPALFLRRTEMENHVDAIIREELRQGLLKKLSAGAIQTLINQRIIEYLNAFPSLRKEPITYHPGFGSLLHTQYSSLLITQEWEPLTLLQLNQNSHVLILPITGNARYGEYSYTGGVNATSILINRLHAQNEHTLFALPSGYRACATTIHPAWECIPYPS
jgi:hypothetical protein